MQHNDVKKPSIINDLTKTLGLTSLSVLSTQPLRYGMNIASQHSSIAAAMLKVMRNPMNGVSWNVMRGTGASGLQFFTKDQVQQQFGFTAGILSAACLGTLVASCIETGFIRKNNLPAGMPLSSAFFKFNVPLTCLYLSRELGFCMAVLAKKDLSVTSQQGVTLAAAGLTAVLHKLIVTEVTRDFSQPGITSPDLREGVMPTIRKLSYGLYTDPRYAVPNQHPDTFLKLSSNLFKAGCGLPIFFFRYAYLQAFGLLSLEIPKVFNAATNRLTVFTRHHATNDSEKTNVVQNNRAR